MRKALWGGVAAGALVVGVAMATRRKESVVFEVSGLQQLERGARSDAPTVAKPLPAPGTWAALTEAAIFARVFGSTSVLGVTFGKPLPRAFVGGGWGDGRPSRVGTYHYAIDLGAKTGTPIYASTSGVVVRAEARGGTTAGKHVVVKHGGVSTRYLHMSAVQVERGQRVEVGQTLGLVGSTGFSSGPHLHLDVFLSDALLAVYRDRYGTPTPAYPRKRRWGTQVPAESLIPVDGYSARVKAAARQRGVELLTQTAIS